MMHQKAWQAPSWQLCLCSSPCDFACAVVCACRLHQFSMDLLAADAMGPPCIASQCCPRIASNAAPCHSFQRMQGDMFASERSKIYCLPHHEPEWLEPKWLEPKWLLCGSHLTLLPGLRTTLGFFGGTGNRNVIVRFEFVLTLPKVGNIRLRV